MLVPGPGASGPVAVAASSPLDTAATASSSHPSTLDLVRHAASAGSYTALHVVTVPEELSVIRVEVWAADGGNGVPGARIREPHRRLRDPATQAIARVDTATFSDSTHRSGPHKAALFVSRFALRTPTWPTWAPAARQAEDSRDSIRTVTGASCSMSRCTVPLGADPNEMISSSPRSPSTQG